mgnify:CR=1 FL=1
MIGVEEVQKQAENSNTNQINDVNIYDRYINGDKTAFEEILHTYRHGLTRYLYRCVGDLETAEELSEDCFVELFLHPGRYRREASLKNYLYAVARHKAASHLRRHRRVRFVPIEEVAAMCLDNGAEERCAAAERLFAAAERRQAVMRALSALPEDYGVTLYLLYFEGLSCEAAAKAMGKSRKQLYNLTARAKAAMREQLEKEGFADEDGLGI